MSATGAEEPISKSEFARRRKITPGRVSQYLAEGKISGDALDGQGREAKIVESIACAQLQSRLDVGQRLGNGLRTRLDAAPPLATAPVLPFQPPSRGDAVADQIARERLEQFQRTNRREAIAEAAEAGRLTDTAVVAQVVGRLAAQMVTVFEGALPELAASLARTFEIPHRDALHLLRGEFRKVRESAAAVIKRHAQEMPAMVSCEIETLPATDDSPDHERGTGGDGGDGEGMGATAAG